MLLILQDKKFEQVAELQIVTKSLPDVIDWQSRIFSRYGVDAYQSKAFYKETEIYHANL